LFDPFGLSIAFTLGLFSTLHCWGMCGGIITALSLGLPASVRDNPRRLLLFSTAYNTGRITSYALAGLAAGLAGDLIRLTEQGFIVLQWLAGVILIYAGLRLAGWAGNIVWLERVGHQLWRYLQPIGRPLMPIDRFHKAYLMGMVWGWLPCGLVYTALLLAAASGSSLSAALFMLAFGIGTLPGMIGAGFVGGSIRQWLQRQTLRYVVGVILITIGILIPIMHLPIFHPSSDPHAAHVHQH